MVTLHAVQAHNAAPTSLASGLVAVFSKFTCSNIPHFTMKQLLQTSLYWKPPTR
jgi:hypothetical protein